MSKNPVYLEIKSSTCHDARNLETHLFLNVFNLKKQDLCDYGLSTDIFTHTVEHTHLL